jgi:hypothetical protein
LVRKTLAVLLVLYSGCATSGDRTGQAPEMDISEAFARAAAQMHSPYTAEAKGNLYAASFGALLKCKVPNGDPVDIALVINAAGRVDAVYVHPLNRRTRCLQHTLQRAKLPKPPEAPFFLSLNSSVTLGW